MNTGTNNKQVNEYILKWLWISHQTVLGKIQTHQNQFLSSLFLIKNNQRSNHSRHPTEQRQDENNQKTPTPLINNRKRRKNNS